MNQRLPIDVLRRLAAIPLLREELGDDCIVWHHAKSNEIFSYNTDGCWKQIWRSQVPQRIRSFIWLVRKGRIATNEYSFCCELTDDDYCPKCKSYSYIETAIHTLRDCYGVRELWMMLLKPQASILLETRGACWSYFH